MPEGDTIFRTARTLQRALAGDMVTGFMSVYPALTRVDVDRPLRGRVVESVRSRGKHLLIAFAGDLILHTHMRMHGSWHVYRPDERWQRPRRDMRIVLETARFVTVAFNVPVAEFLTGAALSRHPTLQALGPDLADPDFDPAQVIARIRAHGQEPMHDLLLNQRVVAGIGNVFKSEVLFEAGVDPFAPAAVVPDDVLYRVLEIARKQMAMNIAPQETNLGAANQRHTTGSLDPNATLWVYGRGRQPCRRCDAPIQSRATGLDGRLTYWCPNCQR